MVTPRQDSANASEFPKHFKTQVLVIQDDWIHSSSFPIIVFRYKDITEKKMKALVSLERFKVQNHWSLLLSH